MVRRRLPSKKKKCVPSMDRSSEGTECENTLTGIGQCIRGTELFPWPSHIGREELWQTKRKYGLSVGGDDS